MSSSNTPKLNITDSNVSEQIIEVFESSEENNKSGRPEYFAERNNHDSQVRCDVCYDHEYEEGDEIVMCDRCNCSVHLTCYKNDASLKDGIPDGDWFC